MSITAPHAASDTANSTNSTQAAPTGVTAGDLMLLIIAWNVGTPAATVTNPSGWTQVGSDVVNGSTIALRVLKKIATSGDVGATYTFGLSSVEKSATACLSYTGATDVGVTAPATDGAGTTHAAPALSGMQAGGTSWAVNVWSERSSTNTSWSIAGADTQRVDQLGTGGGAVSLLVGDSNAGVASRAAETSTAGVSSVSAMMSLELLATAGIVAPGAPTGVTATPGNGSATVSFTPGATGGGTPTYTATSSPGGFTHTGTGSPITVAGLTNGTAYTFTVTATNTAGSATSSASSSVTPTAGVVAFRGWGINLTPGVKVTPPAAANTLVGIAPPSQSQSAWDTTGGFAKLTASRYYSTGMPTNWASSAGAIAGPTQWLASVKPNVTSTIAGSEDAAITAWAKTVPNGTYVTAQHEPEQKSKGISPAQFGQFFARFYSVVKAANPTLLVGPVVQTYTSNARATDSLGNIAGRNTWLEQVQANGVTPDWVGFDGYQGEGNGTSISDIFTAPSALATGLWPGVSLVAGEFGYHSAATADSVITAWLINGYAWFNANGYAAIYYWDGTNFTLDSAELTALGGLT